MIKSAILQLENYGLIESRLHSISFGDNTSSTPKYVNVNEVGNRFKNFVNI